MARTHIILIEAGKTRETIKEERRKETLRKKKRFSKSGITKKSATWIKGEAIER